MTTLFCDLPKINWFVATNFPNKDVIIWKIICKRHLKTDLQQETSTTTTLSQTSQTFLANKNWFTVQDAIVVSGQSELQVS